MNNDRAVRVERRQFGRRQTGLAGWLRVGGRPRLPCILRNISPNGALLEMDVPSWLPFSFDLQIGDSADMLKCEIRHVLPNAVGVTFALPDSRSPSKTWTAASQEEEWGGKRTKTLKTARGSVEPASLSRRPPGII